MHELGIVMKVVDEVEQVAKENNVQKVTNLRLEVGEVSSIVPDLKGTPDEAEYAAKKIEQWLQSVGITKKLADEGFSEADVDSLVNLTFETPSLSGLLAIAPVDGTKEVVKAIFTESLHPYN